MLWQTLLLVLVPSSVVLGKSNLAVSDCKCDGTQYFIPMWYLTHNACGRWAMCSWDMNFYLTNMPEATNKTLAAEYEKDYKEAMSVFTYPLHQALEGRLAKCRRRLKRCGIDKLKIVKAECRRVYLGSDWAKLADNFTTSPAFFKKGTYNIDTANELLFNGWRLYIDGLDRTRPIKRFRYRPSEKYYFQLACPFYLTRPTWTMSFLLKRLGNVTFHEDLSVHPLSRLIKPSAVRSYWCDQMANRITDLYLAYKQKLHCDEWHHTGQYICLNLNADKVDSQKRNVTKECNAPKLLKHNEAFKDFEDVRKEQGKHFEEKWFYPDYPDYPETKPRYNTMTLPWFR